MTEINERDPYTPPPMHHRGRLASLRSCSVAYVVVTPAILLIGPKLILAIRASIFGEGSVTEAVILENDGRPAGFAVWFYSYSTWQAKNGLYLEDLYVSPDYRGTGAGKMLLKHLAGIAVEKGCGRFEWSVLDWNESAIRFYERMGASLLPDWRICRLSGTALQRYKTD